jgi:hypothetical protein
MGSNLAYAIGLATVEVLQTGAACAWELRGRDLIVRITSYDPSRTRTRTWQCDVGTIAALDAEPWDVLVGAVKEGLQDVAKGWTDDTN